MVLGLGIDIIEIERIKKSIEKYGDRFLNKQGLPLKKLCTKPSLPVGRKVFDGKISRFRMMPPVCLRLTQQENYNHFFLEILN